MKKGSRSVFKLCACGCGNPVPPTLCKISSRVAYYPKFIPKHGHKDWGKRLADRLKNQEHPRTKPLGSKQFRSDGYVKIKTEHGWVYEHRHLLQAASDKIVHHKDGNPSNNSVDNLEEMFEKSHLALHHTLHPDQWSKQFRSCKNCSTTDRKHSAKGLCSRCYQQQQAVLKGRWP